MKILLLEPFYGGAHKRWADQLKSHISFPLDIWSLPARFWKWRMHGSAITFAQRYNLEQPEYDLILCSDFLDVSQFKSLTQTKTPIAIYFHENQFAYPSNSSSHEYDMHYRFLNFSSALNADYIYFNSQYNYDTFFTGVNKMLKRMPDFNNFYAAKELDSKASVLPLGIDFSIIDKYVEQNNNQKNVPLIIWNHRWEHDKNPSEFFDILIHLSAEGFDFDLAVLGERNQKYPQIFDQIKVDLEDHLVHWGYVESYQEYIKWLWRADICPVTSQQDFFGISIAEAIYCQCQVFLPNRLSYPKTFPCDNSLKVFYETKEELINRINQFSTYNQSKLKEGILKYDWSYQKNYYREAFQSIVIKNNRN